MDESTILSARGSSASARAGALSADTEVLVLQSAACVS